MVETPLMKQYMVIKAKYPGALLLFRVGDFYETFGEDAITASKILGIVLTKRANGSASHIELAGFPHHSVDTYLPKLVRAGYRVAICDQLEDPKMVKGIVKRGVTELVTPGLSMNDNVLDVKRNNYLAAVHFSESILGIALLDISTGEFYAAQGNKDYVEKIIQSFSPSEIIYPKSKRKDFELIFGDKFNTFVLDEWIFAQDYAFETLTRHFKTSGLKGFGIDNLPEGTIAAGAVLHYLNETEHRNVDHITAVSRIEEERYVWLDRFTIRNLELVGTGFEGGVSLISILDKTTTPMGSRMLKNWMLLPLKEIAPVKERQDVVEKLVVDDGLLESILSELKPIGDLERLISKVAARRVTPRELQQLYRALSHVSPVKNLLEKQTNEAFRKMAGQLNPCDFILDKIGKELKEDPPVNIALGNVIQNGVDEELDQLRKIAFSGKEYLADIQYRESQRTGINSLKISFNKVFGYYIEVSNSNKDKVPAEWIRKQTLANQERYITEELKIYEEKILTAEEKISAIEIRLFNELVLSVADFVRPIQLDARVLAQLDCLCSFAKTAVDFKYAKPEINEGLVLDIKGGRHPVIERQLPLGEPYIPNDVLLDNENQQIIIITGPNMAGKSALLRQTALIVLLAQMGSFVPAQSANIGLVDKIFTRVGASDNLSKGESTFMVEMTETASILNNISARSLVLMDEIGRGTSTYDGISIAWSIVEYLHNHAKSRPRTLFATHYHELNEIAKDLSAVKNYNVSVKESNGKVIFMRKLKEGGSEHSFGIHVAQIAGMPNSVVIRANEVLHHLEKEREKATGKKAKTEMPKPQFQLNIFESNDPAYLQIKTDLEGLDINTISPVEALLKLNEWKNLVKK